MPDSAVFDFGDYRFFMCHGHRHSVQSGYNPLVAAAQNNEAHVVLFGHAHTPINKTENGILILNPGSVSRPRSKIGATFAVIECKEKLEVEFFGIGTQGNIGKLKNLSS